MFWFMIGGCFLIGFGVARFERGGPSLQGILASFWLGVAWIAFITLLNGRTFPCP